MPEYYAIQHVATHRFVSEHPGYGVHVEHADEAEAVAWGTEREAKLWRVAMPDQHDWQVVPIQRTSAAEPEWCGTCRVAYGPKAPHKCKKERLLPKEQTS